NALNEIGIRLDDEQLQSAYLKFLELADRKKHVTAADLAALVSNQLEAAGDTYHLVQWKVDIASGEPVTADVILAHGDHTLAGHAEGNGPVEAIFKAIETAAQVTAELEFFQIEAVTPRADAQGQAHVRIRANDKLYTGHGLATDIV